MTSRAPGLASVLASAWCGRPIATVTAAVSRTRAPGIAQRLVLIGYLLTGPARGAAGPLFWRTGSAWLGRAEATGGGAGRKAQRRYFLGTGTPPTTFGAMRRGTMCGEAGDTGVIPCSYWPRR